MWHRFSTGDVIFLPDDYSLGGREAPHFAQKPARLRFLLPHFGHPLRPRGAPPRNAAAMIQTPAMDPPMHSTNIRAVIGPTSDLPSACRPGTLHHAPGHAGEVYPESTRSAFIIPPGVLNAGKALNRAEDCRLPCVWGGGCAARPGVMVLVVGEVLRFHIADLLDRPPSEPGCPQPGPSANIPHERPRPAPSSFFKERPPEVGSASPNPKHGTTPSAGETGVGTIRRGKATPALTGDGKSREKCRSRRGRAGGAGQKDEK